MNFVKNGVLRLPPGFRFHPTDEELVLQYLHPKVHSFPLPASIIPEVDLCNSDPWELPGDADQERFFFSTKELKYPNGNRSNRATLSGYWKATGLDKHILTFTHNQPLLVGIKKTLVFYRRGSRTDWIMHEYRLANPTQLQGTQNWVLCRIFLNKRRNNGNQQKVPVLYDFMAAKTNTRATDLNLTPASSSSSGSSGITDDASSSSSCHEHSTNDVRKKQSS